MVVVNKPLLDEARTIFTDLGYTVTDLGSELRAERKWRIVYVTADDPDEVTEDVDLRCFITNEDRASRLREELLARGPDYDWAVMSVGDDGYDVLHPQSSQALPT
ncbi:hypothetical protein ACFQPA_03035 [Halomarina halobia]|uniref:Uncharacterized protein n=1 Tax=Halomarina halobia TaxID=3033386 RepID=A0ABD6A4Z0_9EURY|nr:hypothetical protein [Halomarina sp. PSR21]